jgi:hypothetical protein
MLPALGLAEDVCLDCTAQQGLCARHERDVLPQLARNIGWLKMMGEARTEQRGRQRAAAPASVSPAGAAHKLRQASARATARIRRRGMYGLLAALATP